MTHGNSRVISTDQDGPYDHLKDIVEKHIHTPFVKPYADHSLETFRSLDTWIQHCGRPVILDSCCGIGESSFHLSQAFPNHCVLGLDKSAHRISRNTPFTLPSTVKVVRADLNDLFRLIADAQWPITHHYILYPNPWPKSRQFRRRWHGSPLLPSIVKIGGILELRSNWRLYLEEFEMALNVFGHQATLEAFAPQFPLTPFERKYNASGHPLFQLISDLECFVSSLTHSDGGYL